MDCTVFPRVRAHVGRLVCSLVCACLTWLAAAPAVAEVAAQKGWKRLQTPNFEILGNPGDRDLRMVAERLELFREAMGLLVPNALRPSDARIRVLVFRNHKAYDPFKPLWQGKPAALGGYFLNGDDVAHITLTVENRDGNFQIIQHEYVHLMMADSLGTLPPWVSEGIAEYYSSFATAPDGKQVHLGIPHASHVYQLREQFLPLATLVAATRESTHYNERDKRGTFYAESWALIHYLLLGNQQKYSAKASTFIGAVAGGRSLDQASLEVLGIPATQLEKELRAYVERGQFMMQTAKFDERLARLEKLPIEPVADADVHAALGDLLQRLQRDDDAEAQLTKAIGLDPESPVSHAAIARIRLRQGRQDEARTHLERATSSPAATFLTHYQFAAVLGQVESGDAAADSARRARQEAALRRVVEINPRYAEAWHQLGAMKGQDPANAAEARTLVQKAIDLAPGRERYLLTMAYLYANGGTIPTALSLSRSLSERATDDDVRQRAATLHERLAAYERHAKALAAARAANRETPTTSAAETAAPGDVRFDEPANASRFIPDLRALQAGEVRRYGFLVAIDCTPTGGVVIRVDSDGRPLAVKAARFEDIEFITYRDDLNGRVSCGRRPSLDSVYVTWRGEASHAGLATARAVAIEFLPKGFLPPKQDPLP
ncbi:MAG TPA: DUF1570 domain-containing protein [Luteitalea sp.]|nr:DUF1570 domain-containing protein [Luteitalea sp.]